MFIIILLVILFAIIISRNSVDEHYRVVTGKIVHYKPTGNEYGVTSVSDCVNSCIDSPDCASAMYNEEKKQCLYTNVTQPYRLQRRDNGYKWKTIYFDKGEKTSLNAARNQVV